MALRFTNIFAMMADFALHPSTNSEAQEDKYPEKNDKKLRMIVSAFDKLEVDISEAMDAGDPGKFGDSNPHPIWKTICKSRYDVWRRQRALELDIAPQSCGRIIHPGNAPNGNGRGGGRGGGGYNANANGNANGNGNANANGNGNGNGAGNANGKASTTPGSGPTRGIFVLKDPTKRIGVGSSVKVPTFPWRGADRELCVRFTTRLSGGCPFGKKCALFHMTEQGWSKQDASKQAEVAQLVNSVQNLSFAEGFDPSGNNQGGNGQQAPAPTPAPAPAAAGAPPKKKARANEGNAGETPTQI
jgi:hypothetical protein